MLNTFSVSNNSLASLSNSLMFSSISTTSSCETKVTSLHAISAEDDAVDHIYEDIYHELIRQMIANPEQADLLNYSLWIAHNLERLADRVTNICERTVFIATGETIETASDDDEVLLP